MKVKKILDLFSGTGNFSLGLHRAGGFETRAFCEVSLPCHRVLEKNFPGVTIHENVSTLSALDLDFKPDVICGGFPCTDLSKSGKGAGLHAERSGLWFEYLRLIQEAEPVWAIIENVPALRPRGLDEVLGGLSALGYHARWDCIPASALGADQARDRLWIIANRSRQRIQGLWALGLPQPQTLAVPLLPVRNGDGKWEVEPDVRRTAYGNGRKLDGRMNTWQQRLHQIGNSVVPQIVEAIGREINRMEESCQSWE